MSRGKTGTRRNEPPFLRYSFNKAQEHYRNVRESSSLKRLWVFLLIPAQMFILSCSSDLPVKPAGKATQAIPYECLDSPELCQDSLNEPSVGHTRFLILSRETITGEQSIVRLDVVTQTIEEIPHPNRSTSDILVIAPSGSIYWTDWWAGAVFRYDFQQTVPDTLLLYDRDGANRGDPWMDASTETLLWIEDDERYYKFCRQHVSSTVPDCFRSEMLVHKGEAVLGSAQDDMIYWKFNTFRKREVTLVYSDFNTQETVIVATLPNLVAWPLEFIGFHQSFACWKGLDNRIWKSDEYLTNVELVDDTATTLAERSFVFTDGMTYYVGADASPYNLIVSRRSRATGGSVFLRGVDLSTGAGENIFTFPHQEFEFSKSMTSIFFLADVKGRTMYWQAPGGVWKMDIDTGAALELAELKGRIELLARVQ